MLVPQAAVQQTSRGQIVWIVDDDDQAEAKPVKTGDWVDGEWVDCEWVDCEWVVTAGLAGGERVIVEGFQRVRPGASVKAVPYRPDGASGEEGGRTASAADYLEVLYANNELFDAELIGVDAQIAHYTALIDVYKSIGGGWVDEAVAIAPTVDEVVSQE